MNMYFPNAYETPDCSKCEKETCDSRGKHQRNKRDFAYTSGRCPRLPDLKGFVDKSEEENQAKVFPIVHAELGGDELYLTLTTTANPKGKKVYITKSGYWYINDKTTYPDGETMKVKRVIRFNCLNSKEQVKDYMKLRYADYCKFVAEITENII